jgi:hypothetical protein
VRDLEAHRRNASAHRRAPVRPGASLERNASFVLDLQRTVGNRAVGRLLSRSPQTWAASDVARTIAGYEGSANYWNPIRTRVAAYGRLTAAAAEERRASLDSLATSIAEWEQNQSRNWWLSDLDKRKVAAVSRLKDLMADERRELAEPATGTSSPAASPQPRARVPRLLPGLVLPRPDREKWNFGQDEAGEKAYDEIGRTITALEALQNAVNNSGLTVAPMSEQAVDRLYATLPKHQIVSSYHQAGEETARGLYREAGAAGYDINNVEVRKLLDTAIGLAHSHYYQSDVTRTGILLQ